MSDVSITALKGIGPKNAERFAQLHILSIQDLLFHLPSRYEDRSCVRDIATVKPGDRVLVEGVIQSTQITGARRYLKCVMTDASGDVIDLVFFYFADSHKKRLSVITGKVRCFGEIRRGFSGHLEIVHPEYACVDQILGDSVLSLTPGLSPIYPTTKGLLQSTWRKIMRQALKWLSEENYLPELLPEDLVKQHDFFDLQTALHYIHFPPLEVDTRELIEGKHPAQQRLIFEELIAHQLSLQVLRHQAHQNHAFSLMLSHQLSTRMRAQLSFTLTSAQDRVIQEIQSDMEKSVPMLRLVQGDVGSGKTIVSCFAALQALESGYQVALMAPTEILSEQHAKSFFQWLHPLGIKMDKLLGKQSDAEQAAVKSRLASGETQFVIGTHALFQGDVVFNNLALLVIDEQHRFGVHQRLALLEKGLKTGKFPHQLIMTATPIPRTLAMTAYADLDVSVIDELPPGRKPISTVLIPASRRDDVIERVRVNCGAKKQAYWVCTLIEESEALQCQAAETTAHYLQSVLPELHIGLVHGRLKSDEKNALMQAFKLGEIDLLVATTVIEVGVDVANASLMIIENAERLGLAQLHQLRGRVGRGDEASFCVLLYQHPLSDVAKKRLSVMKETQDGFVIAEEDLQMRGPGDVLGVRQSGLMQLRVADLMRDQHLLPLVQSASQQIVKDYPHIVPLLTKRWIGGQSKYMNA